MPAVVVIYGPQGCGKTRHADALQARYGCANVIDEWDGRAALPADALALTNAEPPYPIVADVVEFHRAMGSGRP